MTAGTRPTNLEQFKAKLAERLEGPRVDADKLAGLSDCYKIKLRAAGYRLVFRVEHRLVTVVVVTVGKRERNAVYKSAARRS
ncbi:MAG: type II toxin-antitoxin system RelE/ParE family toxin [Pseudomonadota bacterium]